MLNTSLYYHGVFVHVEFRKGQSPILLATDVASRGLGKLVVAMCLCDGRYD